MAGIPQIKIVFDRRKKASAVNPGTVEIEVSYNRERVRLSTGVAVLKQQWNGKEVVNHPQADHLNEQDALEWYVVHVRYISRNLWYTLFRVPHHEKF